MKKIKLFIVTLTIMIFAANCFTAMAMAAQISWVNESKGRVHINGGMNDGFVEGATVCFIISSGEKLVCGVVQSAEASIAVVKVDKNSSKRMRKGTEAMLYVEKEDKEEIKETEDKETMEDNPPSTSMGIHDQKGY